MTVRKMTGAQAFVECLKLEGVEFVFGVPGGQTLSIMDTLFDTPAIRFVTARHEAAAAHMADAYGRVSGKPGICLATTGPGATNLLTGIGGAFRDSSPVVVVTCNNRRRHIGTDDNQDAEHVSLFRQFTKHSRFVPDAEAVPHATREAFRVALTGNHGPAHLDFARDAIENGAMDFDPQPPRAYRPMRPPCADPLSIEEAVDALLRAKRPAIWAGRGAVLARAGDAILDLARALRIPVVTTYNGIGSVAGNDPIVFGPRSRNGTRLTNAILQSADCVVAIGNSMNAPSTSRWTMQLPQNLIHVDVDPTIIGRNYPVSVAVVGDARDAVERMTTLLSSRKTAATSARREFLREAEKWRAAWLAEMHPADHAKNVPIKPQWLMHEAARLLDTRTTVIADAGNPGIWTHLLPTARSGGYLKPVGFGNMGFGLPAAIATKLARPDDRIIAFIGDGSLGMSLAEIETAVREKTPVAIVVMNDMAYGNIKQEELHYFGQRYIGVDFTDVNYADLARVMGADGERVSRPEDVTSALERALSAPLPYLVDVLIDPADNVWDEPI
ncbi:MAG: thiamine pyrophosphate-binding protein [Rhodospirillales bacterium]|nr:thiamine pyrophosphate-binding protein [Rhodospirillales bacterium]